MVKPKSAATATGAPAGAGDGESAAAESSKVNASSAGPVKTAKLKVRKVVKVKRAKKTVAAAAAAATDEVASVGAGAASGAPAPVSVTQPAAVAEASPVPQGLKPDTDAEGSVPQTAADAEVSVLKPATDAEASVLKPATDALVQKPATDAPAQKPATDAEGPVEKPATNAEGSVPAPVPANAEASASAAKENPAGADASKGKAVSGNTGSARKMRNKKGKAKEKAMNGKGKETEDDGGSKGKGHKAVVKKDGKVENKAAGFIFMCNQKTKKECYQNRLFGLPNGKAEMVKKIKPGAKLFLYDFDLKLLYGVYKAASTGGLNIVQEAFHGKFPAQVKFKIDRDCLPLRESSFKHAIKENYNSKSKFDPELSLKQVQRLIALFKPINVPQSVPNNRLDKKRHYGERRQPYHLEKRRRLLPIEEVRQPRFDEQRRPAAMHAPVEDPYRAPRFAPYPVESRLGRSLANVQDEHPMYYEPVNLAPEPRHLPLAMDSRHVPRALERQPVHVMPEPRHVPPAYYHTSAPSDDSYWPERTLAERTVHAEELYRPDRADRMGISTRGDRLEELYRSEQLDARIVDLPRHSTYYETHPAYAEPSQRSYSARADAPGGTVSSLYSFSGGRVYR